MEKKRVLSKMFLVVQKQNLYLLVFILVAELGLCGTGTSRPEESNQKEESKAGCVVIFGKGTSLRRNS